jgi:hypothetical protein
VSVPTLSRNKISKSTGITPKNDVSLELLKIAARSTDSV